MKQCIKSLSMLAVAASMLLTSCYTDDEIIEPEMQASPKINLSGEISQVYQTRVNDAGFCDGDQVGIYVVDYNGSTAGELLDEGNRGDNVKHTFDEANFKWNGAYDLYFKDNRTNVDIHNRLVCYDIKELGNQLKKIGMLIVQDQVWGRVTANRSAGKSTRYYIDEFHLLLKEEQTASYSIEIWKRFRKWGGIPTGITQNVKDLLSSHEVENIFENSDFIYMRATCSPLKRRRTALY